MADEKGRWEETIERLDALQTNFVGDVIISCGYIAYLGPFTIEYRKAMASEWKFSLNEHKVPHSEEADLNCISELIFSSIDFGIP